MWPSQQNPLNVQQYMQGSSNTQYNVKQTQQTRQPTGNPYVLSQQDFYVPAHGTGIYQSNSGANQLPLERSFANVQSNLTGAQPLYNSGFQNYGMHPNLTGSLQPQRTGPLVSQITGTLLPQSLLPLQPWNSGVRKNLPAMRLLFVSTQDQAKLEQLFLNNVPDATAMSADVARGILIQSQLSPQELSKIWNLCDTGKTGRLLFPQFALAMYLCDQRKRGNPTPESVPTRIMNEVTAMIDQINASLAKSSQTISGNDSFKQITSTITTQNTGSHYPLSQMIPIQQTGNQLGQYAPYQIANISNVMQNSGNQAGQKQTTVYQPVSFQQQSTGYQPTSFQQQNTGYQPVSFQQQNTGYQPTSFQQQNTGYQPVSYQQQNTGYQPKYFQQQNTGYQPTSFQEPNTGFESSSLKVNQQSSIGMQPTGSLEFEQQYSLDRNTQRLLAQKTGNGTEWGFINTPQTGLPGINQLVNQLMPNTSSHPLSGQPPTLGSAEIPSAITKDEKAIYDKIFKAWDKNDSGFITGENGIRIFSQSNLPAKDLELIWALADPSNRGKLNSDEFAIALHLIYRKLNNHEIPPRLPPELISPSMRNFTSSVLGMRDKIQKDIISRKSAFENFDPLNKANSSSVEHRATTYRFNNDESIDQLSLARRRAKAVVGILEDNSIERQDEADQSEVQRLDNELREKEEKLKKLQGRFTSKSKNSNSSPIDYSDLERTLVQVLKDLRQNEDDIAVKRIELLSAKRDLKSSMQRKPDWKKKLAALTGQSLAEYNEFEGDDFVEYENIKKEKEANLSIMEEAETEIMAVLKDSPDSKVAHVELLDKNRKSLQEEPVVNLKKPVENIEKPKKTQRDIKIEAQRRMNERLAALGININKIESEDPPIKNADRIEMESKKPEGIATSTANKESSETFLNDSSEPTEVLQITSNLPSFQSPDSESILASKTQVSSKNNYQQVNYEKESSWPNTANSQDAFDQKSINPFLKNQDKGAKHQIQTNSANSPNIVTVDSTKKYEVSSDDWNSSSSENEEVEERRGQNPAALAQLLFGNLQPVHQSQKNDTSQNIKSAQKPPVPSPFQKKTTQAPILPPPPPPVPISSPADKQGNNKKMGALLASIKMGKALKHTETNDRSAPKV